MCRFHMLKGSYHSTSRQTWCKKWNAEKGEGEMSLVKQVLGFPQLHPVAQHSRHKDHMPTTLSERLVPPFFFCTLLPPFPSSCGPPISTEPQGAGGRLLGWPGQLPPQHHLSPTAPAELLLPGLPPQDLSLAIDISALSQKVGWTQLRHHAHGQIRGHSNMNTIPGGVLHLP